jgi:hypothetical protein
MLTADDPQRLAAILAPLRGLADEIVLAVDDRVDAGRMDAYGALADRLFTIEYVQSERHLAWLHAQCRGDWILRLDGDELLSPGLVERLPELLRTRTVQQFWMRRLWLHPDAQHVLDELPWSEDFVNRLVRNDGTLWMSGRQHSSAEPVAPGDYVEEPIFHLDLLLADHRQRSDKAIVYEAIRPGLIASGGGRINEAFYLPELRDSPSLRELDDVDCAAVAAVMEGTAPEPSREPAVTRAVTLCEMDSRWEARAVAPDAYRASIAPLGQTLRFVPGESRHVFVRVRNDGSERWPCRLRQRPEIRLSYRWLEEDGSERSEGPRSPLPREVAPGETLLAPVHVIAPDEALQLLLEIDLVHEHVRWFGSPLQLPVTVARLPALRTPGEELRAERRPGDGEPVIPRVFHRVEVATHPASEPQQRRDAGFEALNPGWSTRRWRAEHLHELDISAELAARCRSESELSNLVRYEVLARYGGVYVGPGVECLRPLAGLVDGLGAFAQLTSPGRLSTDVLGASPGHALFVRAALLARRTLGTGETVADANGAGLLTLIAEQEPGLTVLPWTPDERAWWRSCS